MKAETTIYRGKFTTRGRITIPAAIRRKFGLKGGSKLTVSVKANGYGMLPALVLKPVGAKRRWHYFMRG